jgi:hypothetical protein
MTPQYSTNVAASPDDPRDLGYLYTGHTVPSEHIPPFNRDLIRNQARLGACVAHGNGHAVARLARSHGVEFDPSELFAHYKALELDGLLGQPPAVGVIARTGLKVLNRFGLPTETDWPYVEAQYNTDPGSLVHTKASMNRVGRYERIALDFTTEKTVMRLKQAISEGVMVCGAMSVMGDWLFKLKGPLGTHSAQIGDGDDFYGSHWMHFHGYSDSLADGCFIMAQSWGTEGPGTGEGGYIAIPYRKINLFWELWAIRAFKGWSVPCPLDAVGEVGWQVFRLYRAMFKRAPDWAGLLYHVGAINAGLTLAQVANNFAASPEFQQQYGALSDHWFVERIYLNTLDRHPDADGWAYHENRLAQGATRGEVLIGFSESQEFKDSLTYFR